MNPKVSVIMSAYNCEAYVEEAIQSIIDQTYQDWEILIADDGSTDQTKSVIDSFTDPRIYRYHNKSNLGYLTTWNNLLEYSTGELITWQDADDISHPRRLEKMVEVFNSDTDLMLLGTNSVRYFPFWKKKRISNYPSEYFEILKMIKEERIIPFTGPTRMIRNKVISDIGKFRPFFDKLGFEDLDFILRVSEKFKVANLKEILYEYRYVKGSASRYLSPGLFLKIYINDIGFFLSDQRARNAGLDGLMPGGNKEELDLYLEKLKVQFNLDPSIIHRKSCLNKISNFDFTSAISDAYLAIAKNPKVVDNYLLFLKIPYRFIRAIL